MAGNGGFCRSFVELCDLNDGFELHKLLRTTTGTHPTEEDKKDSCDDDIAAAVVAAWSAGDTPEGLESALDALQKWSNRYLDRNAKVRWMLTPMLWLAARTRQLAVQLDGSDSRRYRERVVEAARALFTKLHRDKDRREGALVICCELLRLYSSLGQASQCAFVLTTVGNASKNNAFDAVKLPKSLLVTLYFLWGKHLVMAGSIEEAEDKLNRALAICPLKAARNRCQILRYLIPCRLRLGQYPTQGLLKRNDLQSLTGIVAATATGNVKRFSEELEKQEDTLICWGTYLVVEKLKIVAYRNLVRHVYEIQCELLEGAQKVKQDLAPFEQAFQWQDDCTPDETLCLLAHLIYIGAVRGYLSDVHRKVVFSKEMPFPPVSSWSTKA
ncbi:unnamed protein product [Durusdinium trenchii]|uniref:Enhanced ethylene response protein 5 (Nuclear mRNA export protein THP1) (AtTHP1) n=2 Tax=Durusdinium trenchii TaxID=1381693 RepID=A0ABP0QT88_9DINO